MFQADKELTVPEVAHPYLPKWRARIDKAEQRGRFVSADKKAAWNWNQCAVGEARTQGYSFSTESCEKHPRIRKPTDSFLLMCGYQFHTAVLYDDFPSAREILAAIEAHLIEIR